MSLFKIKKTVKIKLIKNECVVADQCQIARSFFSRLKGLMGVKNFHEGEALLLQPCKDIHMWFMKIPIDVLFLEPLEKNKTYKISSIRTHVRPWTFFPIRDSQAVDTLELPSGTVERCDLKAGDQLCID